MKKIKQKIWLAIRVERGCATDAQVFLTENQAKKRQQEWRLDMNPDYADANIFPVALPQRYQA